MAKNCTTWLSASTSSSTPVIPSAPTATTRFSFPSVDSRFDALSLPGKSVTKRSAGIAAKADAAGLNEVCGRKGHSGDGRR